MAGAHRSAPLPSAEYLIPAGVTCVPVRLGGSWHSAALAHPRYRLSPPSALCRQVLAGIPEPPSVAQNPIPRADSSELVWHSRSVSQPILGPCPLCPAVLLALDRLQLWPGPAGDLHQPLHHLQAQHAEPAVQRLRQPAAAPQHRLQVTPGLV